MNCYYFLLSTMILYPSVTFLIVNDNYSDYYFIFCWNCYRSILNISSYLRYLLCCTCCIIYIFFMTSASIFILCFSYFSFNRLYHFGIIWAKKLRWILEAIWIFWLRKNSLPLPRFETGFPTLQPDMMLTETSWLIVSNTSIAFYKISENKNLSRQHDVHCTYM